MNPCKKIMLYYRLGHIAYIKNKRIKAKFYENRIYYKFSCHIRVSAEIGKNCIIGHPIGIVIGSGVTIGNNCIIYQGVTIGLRKADEQYYPVVEDGCNLYASAKILGNIRVKKGTSVAANAVLMCDTEENSVYAGLPAKKVA